MVEITLAWAISLIRTNITRSFIMLMRAETKDVKFVFTNISAPYPTFVSVKVLINSEFYNFTFILHKYLEASFYASHIVSV